MIGCTPTVAPPPPTSTSVPPTPIATPLPAPTPTATSLPPPTQTAQPRLTPTPVNLKTFHATISFETYETEETVALELGRLPGVTSVNVTQLEITVQYDPTRLTQDDILRTLRNNPEVRIKDDNPGQ